MFNWKEWRANRKQKKLDRQDPYVAEERRLKELQRTLDPMSPEYEQLQKRIETFNKANKECRENKKWLTPEKASIFTKFIAAFGTFGAIVAVAHYEKDGVCATGEKRTIMDALCSAAGRFLHR